MAISSNWQDFIISRTHNYSKPVCLLTRGEDEYLHLGDIQMIEGLSGCRKTFLVTALCAAALPLGATPLQFASPIGGGGVLLIDTEQSANSVQQVARRVHTLAGIDPYTDCPDFTVLALRELKARQRMEVCLKAIRESNSKLVVIDNIKDLVEDFNNLTETQDLICNIMALATQTNSAICCVIHQNVGTNKARGHLGSFLYEKVSLAISLTATTTTTTVEFQKARNIMPQPFSFTIANGLPTLTDNKTTQDPILKTLITPMDYSTAVTTIAKQTKLPKAVVQTRLQSYTDKKLLEYNNGIIHTIL